MPYALRLFGMLHPLPNKAGGISCYSSTAVGTSGCRHLRWIQVAWHWRVMHRADLSKDRP
jgi:hypothetical protein